MSEIVWDRFQTAVFDDMANGTGHTVVTARAGSGKTTCIIAGLDHLPAWGTVLLTAFNKGIERELKARAPGHVSVRTLHGLGFAALRQHLGKVEVDEDKGRRIAYAVASDAARQSQSRLDTQDLGGKIRRLAALSKNCLVKTVEEAEALAYAFELDSYDTPANLLAQCAAEALRRSTAVPNKIDFDDMVYLPAKLGISPAPYDFVLVDEAQDVNLAQLSLAASACRGRFIAIGDPKQCHPSGVRVETLDGPISIENLDPLRHKIRPWNRHTQRVVGHRQFQIAKRPYNGPIYDISAGGRILPATPNHRFIARWTDRTRSDCCVYLMWRPDRGFRVGWCKLFSVGTKNGTNGFHLAHRARIEKSERTWILKTFKDRTSASVYESQLAMLYGLPTATFEPVKYANHQTENAIHQIFAFLSEEEMRRRGFRCLVEHLKDFELPLYPWPGKTTSDRQGRRTYFEVFAANLEPELMSIPLPDAQNAWTEVEETPRRMYEGFVYSLNVEEDHSYVANGLVTLNSIYQFRGADAEAIPKIIHGLGAKVLPLSVTYRCPTEVVNHVQLKVSGLQDLEPRPRAPKGVVDERHMHELLGPYGARPGDFVLSRLNAPLMPICMHFLRHGIPAVVAGRDMGRNLKSLAEKPGTYLTRDLLKWLEDYQKSEYDRLVALDKIERYVQVQDQIDALRALTDDTKLVSEVTALIDTMFSDDRPTGALICSTVHKAKGLERDRVWLLANTFFLWPGEEESNLYYVACTRSKHDLFLVTDGVPTAASIRGLMDQGTT